jgi:hypothetical protein
MFTQSNQVEVKILASGGKGGGEMLLRPVISSFLPPKNPPFLFLIFSPHLKEENITCLLFLSEAKLALAEFTYLKSNSIIAPRLLCIFYKLNR